MAGSLDDYRKKRDFTRTSEPAPELAAADEASVFVVHRHEARRLHYDLRLQMGGVLRSWAVPKGFSYDPSDKHLAVRTEDHPMKYESFEGMIPKGEYGAGTMTIWDRGRYRILAKGDPSAAVESGKFEIILYGRRLRGEWHLVRTKENWLLFKSRDQYAAGDGVPALGMDLSAAEEAAMPARLRAMKPGDAVEPFSDPSWLFEMEFAGMRAFATKRGSDVTLSGGGKRKLLGKLPAVARDLARLRAGSAVLDGVLVASDDGGRPSREQLERALAGDSEVGVQFYAFDLLHFDGFDLRDMPLLDRKAVLSAMVSGLPSVLYVDHVIGHGEDLHRSVVAAGLPGMIAKRASSSYKSGRGADWREIAAPENREANEVAVDEALQKVADEAPARQSKVALSNLEKIYWPVEGYAKGDLLVFYEQVAELVLPHLQDRPLHLYRWPDGIEGKNFYQQNAPDGVPDWVQTELIQRRHKEEPVRHMICQDPRHAALPGQPRQHRHPPVDVAPRESGVTGLGGDRPRPEERTVLRRRQDRARDWQDPARHRPAPAAQDVGCFGASHLHPAGAGLHL